MNRQEIFNRAYIGVMKQGEPSVPHLNSNACAYFLPATKDHLELRCGIGHVLSRESAMRAQELFAGKNVWSLLRSVSADAALRAIDEQSIAALLAHNNLAVALQRAHDISWKRAQQSFTAFIELYKAAMKEIATNLNLTIPEIA